MNKIATIAGLTWKAAFRYKLFWTLVVLLAAAVVGLPLLLKDDGSAQGMVQILLTYTLSATATLLGFATLWLSCGTLARDIEECQMQMVVVKPIARWQIWLGKWLGILSLNAALLAIAGVAIYGSLLYRASKLTPDQQRYLHEDLFVARASAREPLPDFSKQVDKLMKQVVKDPSQLSEFDLTEIRKQLTARVETNFTVLAPRRVKQWGFDLHTIQDKIKGKHLQLRIRFHTVNQNAESQYTILWRVGPPNSPRQAEMAQTFPADSFQEFTLPDDELDDKGRLWVEMANPGEVDLIFPMEDGMELLYPESTFGINFVRGMCIIFCWLALLASIGLATASQLSFPVAAFVSLAILLMGLSSGTLSTVVENGTVMGYDSSKGGYGHSYMDYAVVPFFSAALKVVTLVQGFSPIDALSSGRSITWGELGRAVLQIIVILGGFFALVGIVLFSRRELATAQGNA